jgi:general secretion pathway protein L
VERLVIRLREENSPVEWLVLDERNNRVGAIQSDELDTLAPQAAGRRVIVFVPGARVPFLTVRLPIRNPQKIIQALPFALEEQLAEDVEQLHFAPGAPGPDGARDVAVVARDTMEAWLARLADAAIQADALLPDTLLPPATADGWHVAIERDEVLVRTGPTAGFTGEKSLAAAVVAMKIEQLDAAERPQSMLIQTVDRADTATTELTAIAGEAGLEMPAIEELPDTTALSLAGASLAAIGHFNLLQGPYQPRRDWEQRWRRWRVAAALAAAWVVLAIAWQGVGYYRMHQQEMTLDHHIASVFHRAMPGVNADGDVRGRLQSRLIQLRKATRGGPSNGLLTMLGALNGIGDKSRINNLSWHDGVLELELNAPDVHTLDALRDRIQNKTHLDVKIESASAKGKSVDGRLRIEGGHETG